MYGVWNLLVLVIYYGAYLHLGVFNIMQRDIPFCKGIGNKQKVEEITNVGLGVSLVIPITAGLIIVAASEIFFSSAPLLRWTLKLMALYLCLEMLFQYSQRHLKAHCKFDKVSIQLLLLSVIIPLVTIPLIKSYALMGMILGQCISLLIVLTITIWLVPFNFNIEINPKKVFPLIKAGFPIMLLGIIYIFFNTVDRWVIVKFLNLEELGYYSLANKVFSSVMLLAYVIGDQLYPRMAEKYGETGNSVTLTPLIFKQIYMTMAVVIPMVVILYFLFPFLVESFLANYYPAISIINIFLVGLLFLSPALTFGSFLIVIGKHAYYLGIMVLSIFSNVVLSIFFVKAMGLGIKGVALGTTGAYLVFSVMLMLTWFLKRKTSWLINGKGMSYEHIVS